MLPGGGSVPSGHGSILFDHHGAGIARQAEALGFDTLLMPDHFGPQFGLWAVLDAAAATGRKLGWVREAAGDRFGQLELGVLVFAVEVTGSRLPAAEALAAGRT